MKKSNHIFGKIIKYSSLVIGVLIALVPIIVVLFASLKTSEEMARTGALSLPENWFNFENYTRAFVEGDMLKGFFNTFIILFVAILGSIIIGSMIAYVLSRFKFRGSNIIMGAFLFAVLIPGVTTQVATFQIINS